MTRNGTGIYERHSRTCPTEKGEGKCNCTPHYQAKVYSRRDDKRISKTFRTKTEAKQWQAEAKVQVHRGTRRAPTKKTISEALDEQLAGMKDGSRLSHDGMAYKPATIRRYERTIRAILKPAIGNRRVGELLRPDLQHAIDQLRRDGVPDSMVVNAIDPLRAIYRRAIRDGDLDIDPTRRLELPRLNGARREVVTEEVAAKMIAAVPEFDQPIWATAFYAGLRVGEIQGLDWEHIEVDRDPEGPAGWIRIERTYDQVARKYVEPKTNASRRWVPILPALEPYILRQYRASPNQGRGPVFFGYSSRLHGSYATCLRDGCENRMSARGLCSGCYTAWQRDGADPAELPRGWESAVYRVIPDRPFYSMTVQRRADLAWKAAGIERVSFHVCRHTFASICIQHRVPGPVLQQWLGHANLMETANTYVKAIPGSEEEAIALMSTPLPKPVSAEHRVLELGPGGDEDEDE